MNLNNISSKSITMWWACFFEVFKFENGLQTALEDSACSEKDLQVVFCKNAKETKYIKQK